MNPAIVEPFQRRLSKQGVQHKIVLHLAHTHDAQSGNNAIAKLTGDASSAKVATSGAINLDALAIENNLDVAAGGNVTVTGDNTFNGTAKLGTTSGTIDQTAGTTKANVIEADYIVSGGNLKALTTAGDVTVKGNLTQNGGDIKDMATLKVVNGTFTITFCPTSLPPTSNVWKCLETVPLSTEPRVPMV